jgi:hypothetical protein
MGQEKAGKPRANLAQGMKAKTKEKVSRTTEKLRRFCGGSKTHAGSAQAKGPKTKVIATLLLLSSNA